MKKVTESYIEGAFRGWTGRGVYKFINGQIWVQKNYKYSYKYIYRPKALIWKDGSKYYLEVVGMCEKISVRRGSQADLPETDSDE